MQPVGSGNDKIVEMMYEVLLHQYKISPSINSYLKVQRSVDVDPFKRFHEIASPDSIEAMCNIFEMYRAMVFMLGEGSYACAPICLQIDSRLSLRRAAVILVDLLWSWTCLCTSMLCSTARQDPMIIARSKNGSFLSSSHWKTFRPGCLPISRSVSRDRSCTISIATAQSLGMFGM